MNSHQVSGTYRRSDRHPQRYVAGRSGSKLLRRAAWWAAAAVLGLAIGGPGCVKDPPPFNPLALQRSERARGEENQTLEMRPAPTRLESGLLPSTRPSTRPVLTAATRPSLGNGERRRLRLADVIRNVAEHNLEAHVSSYDSAINNARVVEALAAYDLNFFTNFNYQVQQNVTPTVSNPTLDPINNAVDFRDLQVQSGFKQKLPTGGEATLQYTTDRVDRRGNSVVGLVNPFWTNELQLQVTQPLLQNFGDSANYARIAIARNTQKSSLLDFRLALEKQMFETEQAYWQLVQATQEVAIREDLSAKARTTAQYLRDRIGTRGTTYAEVAQAAAVAAQREQEVIQFRAQVEELSDQLKNRMNNPDLPVASGDVILPEDQPVDVPITFDANEQIQTALTYRAELGQQQVKISSADITREAAKNNMLPQLNLVGSAGFQGVGKDFHNALNNQGDFNYIDWSIGFQLQIPIGNREARAIYQRTLLQRMQAIDQYRNLVEQVTFDVKKGQRDVAAAWESLRASRTSRLLAEDALRRNEERRDADPITPASVQTTLQLQTDLGTAQRAEVQALVQYNISLAELERAKGTLLRYNNVVIEEETQPYATAVKPKAAHH